MPYRMVCNDVEREGAKPSPELVPRLFCYVPLHTIRYGIVTVWSEFFFISGTVALMKTIPLLPSQPFKAVYAVGAVDAPTHGCYIQ